MSELFEFLPVSKEDMESRGWWWYDALVVGGDAYVDRTGIQQTRFSPWAGRVSARCFAPAISTPW